MNPEEVRKRVTFETIDCSKSVLVIGTFDLRCSRGVSKLLNEVERQQAERAMQLEIQETIVRCLYEDRRNEIWEAVTTLLKAYPFDLEFMDAKDHLLETVRRMEGK